MFPRSTGSSGQLVKPRASYRKVVPLGRFANAEVRSVLKRLWPGVDSLAPVKRRFEGGQASNNIGAESFPRTAYSGVGQNGARMRPKRGLRTASC